MSFYQKHVFFCINQRQNGQVCCQNANASHFRDYTKASLQALGLHGPGKIRVSQSGCLGRCALGPVLVIYPEAVWYSYKSEADIDEIIHEHLMAGRVVSRLLMEPSPPAPLPQAVEGRKT